MHCKLSIFTAFLIGVFVCVSVHGSDSIPKVFSFEKNSKGTNPPGPLSFITLDSKTEEELPSRLVSILQTAFFYFLLVIQGLSSAGLISKGVGTMWDLSTSTDHQGSPGSPPGSGIGQRRAALTSGVTSSLLS